MNNRTLALIVAAILVVVTIIGLDSQQSSVVARPVPADVAAGTYDRVHLSVAAATARNEQATRLCESEINMILARELPEIERAADRAAEEVSTYGSCTTIIYRLAKEQLGWSASTADYVDRRIRSRLQPSLDTCGHELDAALARCELALKESTVTLASELAQANPSAAGQPLDIDVDVRTSGDLDATLRGLGIGGGVLTVAGTFDAVAIMNTTLVRNLIAKIAQLAASIFAKPAATAAGFQAVSLGPHVLRVETAAVALAARLT